MFPLMKEMRVEGGNNPSGVINPGDVTTFNGRKRKRRPNFPPPPVEEEIQENVEEDQQVDFLFRILSLSLSLSLRSV